MRGTEIDGGLEICAHAHGEFRQAVARGHLRQQRKMRSRRLIHRRNAHQPDRFQPMSLTYPGEKIIHIGRCDPGFLFLLSGVDLDEQFRRPAQPVHGLAQFAGEFLPVQNLDHIEQGDSVFSLVGLKRTDQPELKVRMVLAARNPVFLSFLDAIFAENTLAAAEGLVKALIRLTFTDGGERHHRRIAALRLAACGNPVEKGGAPGGDTVWEICHAR